MNSKKIVFIGFLILASVFIIACKEESIDMDYNLYLYQEGNKTEITSDKAAEVIKTTKTYLNDSIGRQSLIVFEENLNELYTAKEAWVIEFKSPQELKIGSEESYLIKKIIIPLTGELAVDLGSENISIITMAENDGYAVWLCPNTSSDKLKP